MNKTYISKDAHRRVKEYLETIGRDVQLVETEGVVDKRISNHPDVWLCKMGIGDDAPVYLASEEDLGMDYPAHASYNAACTGKYFIHNLSITAPALLEIAKEMGMTFIDIAQGYGKCSIAIVDENAIITYDNGIARACESHPDLKVLVIQPGNIKLVGFDTGFIGGTCGRVGNEIIFNGALDKHPDFAKIVDFIEERGLAARWFSEYPLTDIGSIL